MSEPTREGLAEAAERLEQSEPGWLDEVRSSAGLLGLQSGTRGEIAAALADMQGCDRFDSTAPVAGGRTARMAKAGVQRLVQWYIRHLVSQFDTFASAATRLGGALAARAEELDGASRDMQQRVADLEARLSRLDGLDPPERPEPPARPEP